MMYISKLKARLMTYLPLRNYQVMVKMTLGGNSETIKVNVSANSKEMAMAMAEMELQKNLTFKSLSLKRI